MMHEFNTLFSQIKEFEDRVDALEYTVKTLVTSQEADVLKGEYEQSIGNWYWLSGADMLLYGPDQLNALGVKRYEIQRKLDRLFFAERIHPEDYPNFLGHFDNCRLGKMVKDEVEYRIRTKDGRYKRFKTVIQIAKSNDQGKPLVLKGEVYLKSEKKH